MSIRLDSLHSALSSLEELGKREVTFEVQNITVTLQMLCPDADMEIQKYAYSVFEEAGEEDTVANLEYMERIKWGTLSHSIVRIGNLDLRGVDTVETGQSLPNGQPQKIPVHKAIRDYITSNWTRPLTMAVFRKYGELVEKVELESEKLIEYDPVDLDFEIGRLEERLAALREEKSSREEQDKNYYAEQIRTLNQLEEDSRRLALENPVPSEEPDTNPEQMFTAKPELEPLEEPPQYQIPENPAPIIPQRAAPPEKVVAPPPVIEPSPPLRVEQPIPSSFASQDPDELHKQLEAENLRLHQARLNARQSIRDNTRQEETTLRPSSRKPPHLAALQASEPLEEDLYQVKSLGTREGIPVVQYGEPVSLDKKTHVVPPSSVPLNPAKKKNNTRNPRFQNRK